jgi:PIN domain nuclease of toxin-antitoxin system
LTAFLVDSHALLWFLKGDRRLSPSARTAMEADANVLLVSSASLWEIAVKARLGRLAVPDDLSSILEEQGFEPLAVDHRHAWAAGMLPIGEHKDPFDRMLAAQALTEDTPVISGDDRLDAYGVRRHW